MPRQEQAKGSLFGPKGKQNRIKWVFTYTKESKKFSFCKRKNWFLTGGVDCIIHVWNPYLPG